MTYRVTYSFAGFGFSFIYLVVVFILNFQVYHTNDRKQRDRTRYRTYLAGLHVLHPIIYSSQSQLNAVSHIVPSYDDLGVEGQNGVNLFDL